MNYCFPLIERAIYDTNVCMCVHFYSADIKKQSDRGTDRQTDGQADKQTVKVSNVWLW